MFLFAKLCKRGDVTRAAMVIESLQSSLPSTGTGNLVFARMNPKPAVLKDLVFEWALCFRFCEIDRFQSLLGSGLPVKHTLRMAVT